MSSTSTAARQHDVYHTHNIHGNAEFYNDDVHYDFVIKYLEAVPRVDPAAVDTVLEMVGSKEAAKTKLYDNSVVDRLVQEGLVDRLYKGTKS